MLSEKSSIRCVKNSFRDEKRGNVRNMKFYTKVDGKMRGKIEGESFKAVAEESNTLAQAARTSAKSVQRACTKSRLLSRDWSNFQASTRILGVWETGGKLIAKWTHCVTPRSTHLCVHHRHISPMNGLSWHSGAHLQRWVCSLQRLPRGSWNRTMFGKVPRLT